MIPPKDCSGCGACVHICPVRAIEFVKDREGFYYPEIDCEKCVNCGACEKKCPILCPQGPKAVHTAAYAAQNRNEQARHCSSSGGVFSLLAEQVIRLGGIVIGCAMTKDCYGAEHQVITNEQGLSEIRGSKYLQSRADQVYPAVKEALQNGKRVLFSGTPCQVAGLHAYLANAKTENLITIDNICHGVPSPTVWERYVKHWESVKGSKVVSVQFRNKEKGWKTYSLVLSFENGETYKSICTADLYCRGFVGDYFLRRSCYDCHAKGEYHGADITLGDLWGIRHICKPMDDDGGTSLVLLNTAKGEALFHTINREMECQQVDFDEAIRHNPSYYQSSSQRVNRHCFMKHIQKKPIINLLDFYCGTRLTSRIKRKIMKFMATACRGDHL
ncbi:MAG: Coenzyme F420 hydrogenase/dehydrogenase, beta subunit C-terminal domain [Oscillospiraceae bacterium]|nr:Coenzyme F420 hydrogenase/dehydrogenase, beta subunit C-terminal domain [Oscillospiraceae bacterium]